jgi:hypothetical protein
MPASVEQVSPLISHVLLYIRGVTHEGWGLSHGNYLSLSLNQLSAYDLISRHVVAVMHSGQ